MSSNTDMCNLFVKMSTSKNSKKKKNENQIFGQKSIIIIKIWGIFIPFRSSNLFDGNVS